MNGPNLHFGLTLGSKGKRAHDARFLIKNLQKHRWERVPVLDKFNNARELAVEHPDQKAKYGLVHTEDEADTYEEIASEILETKTRLQDSHTDGAKITAAERISLQERLDALRDRLAALRKNVSSASDLLIKARQFSNNQRQAKKHKRHEARPEIAHAKGMANAGRGVHPR